MNRKHAYESKSSILVLIDAIEDEICPLLNFDYLSFLEKTVEKRVIATLQPCQIATV
jgi:hypothetical protein